MSADRELLPRWTVYPALAVLAVFSLTAVPHVRRDPELGLALEARTRVGAATPGEVVPSLATTSTSPASPPVPAPRPPSALDPTPKRVVVLGIDGLDPDILRETIERYPERMTHFARLIEQGGLHELRTSTPPQSPVAWSNFITGLDPGGHGIFDFIHRDPVTRQPAPSTVQVGEASHVGLPGDWQIPLGGESPSNRTGESFWVTLARHGVPADVWRMPANFPVEPAEGLSFSGMMTPALDSAYGTYTLYTTNAPVELERSGGKYVAVSAHNGVIFTHLAGPPNMFKVGDPQVRAPLEIFVDEENDAVAIDTGRDVVVLSPGQWSQFVEVDFESVPLMVTTTGAVRFYLRSTTPDFELYASPVNIDPLAPATPVSQPEDASAALARDIGLYYTQGMAEDVNALKDEVLTDVEFMDQAQLVYDESRRMLDYALDHYMDEQPGGLLFFYFSTVDLASHMMWRFRDEQHPQHKGSVAELAQQDSSRWSGRPGSTWQEVVSDLYMRMDPVLGRLRERIGDDTTLIVMSDHGFESYTRKFSLNTWLEREGYLLLKPGRTVEKAKGDKVYIWDAVDWTRTKAYGMGFNGLYLNLAGRELDDPKTEDVDESGIVEPAEARALLEELKEKLERETDPVTGRRIVLRADIAADIYHGDRIAEAPDILVGYDQGYGNADAASTGRIPAEVVSDNLGGTFNGSHLMSPDVVAGTLITNEKVRPGQHGLEDLTIEVLRQYGIQPLPGQHGHPVLE